MKQHKALQCHLCEQKSGRMMAFLECWQLQKRHLVSPFHSRRMYMNFSEGSVLSKMSHTSDRSNALIKYRMHK